MQTKFVNEGQIKIDVPDPKFFQTKSGDYAPSLTSVFYNPKMEFCRDISVSVGRVLAKRLKMICACDPLAGVGVRGIRYAKEMEKVARVVVNDRSEEAFEMIKRNIKLNEVNHLIDARSADATVVLWENLGRCNFVDIDPFGSPAPFVDAACGALARRGMLALTATDTAPLSGTHARACLRRYAAMPLKTEYCHELGIRILIGFAQRVGAMHEIALTPVLSHATQHYFRVYMLGRKGAKRADNIMKKIGFISHCKTCMRRALTFGLVAELPRTCKCGDKLFHAGPLWLGELIDREFTREVTEDLSRMEFKLKHQELQLLNRCLEEAEGPPAYFEVNHLASHIKIHPLKIITFLSKIRNGGYFASRTHFSDTGFRTDAPMEEIIKNFRGA